MKKLFAVWTVFVTLVSCFAIWFVASCITSGIKVATNNCDNRFPIEAAFEGDLFCAETK